MSPSESPEAFARRAALSYALQSLAQGRVLAEQDIALAFETVMVGEATGPEIGALLLGLRTRGETAAELTGVVRALRKAMIALAADRPGELVDTAGTGGGLVRTFNISTIARSWPRELAYGSPSTAIGPTRRGAAVPTSWKPSASLSTHRSLCFAACSKRPESYSCTRRPCIPPCGMSRRPAGARRPNDHELRWPAR